MAITLSPICQYYSQRTSETNRLRGHWSGNFSTRGISTSVIASSFGASRCLVSKPLCLVSRRSTMSNIVTRPAVNRHGIVCRAAELVDDYGHCKNMEDAMIAIMTDVIQHCLKSECDVMRAKVLDQLGSGLAALFRVSVAVAADTSPAPIPIRSEFSAVKDEDLEKVRRMLQLTSLPFHNTYDEDLRRLTNMLQTGEGQKRRLTGSELSEICERLGSDVVQCLGPLAICFPELPLWAKQRALLMPAEVAGKMALSLIAGPNRK